jgi:hypothetical protein
MIPLPETSLKIVADNPLVDLVADGNKKYEPAPIQSKIASAS